MPFVLLLSFALFVVSVPALLFSRSRRWAKWTVVIGFFGFLGAGQFIEPPPRSFNGPPQTSNGTRVKAEHSEAVTQLSQTVRMVTAWDILSRSAESVVDAPIGVASEVQPAPSWVKDRIGRTVHINSSDPHPVSIGMKTIYMNVDGIEAALVTAGGPYCRLREPSVGAMIKVPCAVLSH